MSTLAKLVVGVTVNPQGLQQGLTRIQAIMSRFQSKQAIAAQQRMLNPLGFQGSMAKTQAAKMANQLIYNLNKQYSQAARDIKFDAAAGKINYTQFRKLGGQAAKEFNDALIDGIQQIRATGIKLPMKVLDSLVDQLKETGIRARDAYWDQVRDIGEGMSDVGKKMTIGLTLPIAGLGVAIAKQGVDFQKAMNRTAAVTAATGKEFDSLYKTARKLGAETEFTPTDVAEAMSKLSLAGFKTERILGTIAPTLALASAAQFDMTTAADVASSVFQSYSISADKAAASIDAMVEAMTSAKVNLVEMGVSFRYGGNLAKTAGLDFNETVAALALLGNAGFRGSLAGTALRGAIARLLNPADEATRTMHDLGIKVEGANKKMLPLVAILKQLEEKGISAGKILEIFGQRAGPGMAELLTQGSTKLEAFTKQLANATGRAQEIRKRQLEGLYGGLFLLRSAIQEAALVFANSGFIQFLDKMARGMANTINVLSHYNKGLITTIIVVGAMVAALGPLVFMLGKLTVAITMVRAAMVYLTAQGAMGGLAALLVPGGAIVVGLTLITGLLVWLALRSQQAGKSIGEFQTQLLAMDEMGLQATATMLRNQIKQYDDIMARNKPIDIISNTGKVLYQNKNKEYKDAEKAKREAMAKLKMTKQELSILHASAAKTKSMYAQMAEDWARIEELMENAGVVSDKLGRSSNPLLDLVGELERRLKSAYGTQYTTLFQRAQEMAEGLWEVIMKQGGPLKANLDVLEAYQSVTGLIADNAERFRKEMVYAARMGGPKEWAKAGLRAEDILQTTVAKIKFEPITDVRAINQPSIDKWGWSAREFGEALARARLEVDDTFNDMRIRWELVKDQWTGFDLGKGFEALWKGAGVEIAEQFTPLGLAATTLQGFFEGLQPVLDALKEPLRLVGEILGKSFAPILKALFPIIKLVAIAATYLGQALFNVTGGILTAVGWFIRAIGKFVNFIVPFANPGNPLVKAGQAMMDLGHGFMEGAAELAAGRDELRKLNWNDALNGLADGANKAADALSNIPDGYKLLLNLRQFQAARGIAPLPGASLPPSLSPSQGVVYSFGDINITSNQDGGEILRQIQDEAERKSRAVVGAGGSQTYIWGG